jgi:glycosyltransferase involved in cell wall biosynthesis
MGNPVSDPRLLVIQNGARHGYAIPQALQRRGALAGVYTDMVSTSGAGALFKRVVTSGSARSAMLQRRTPPAELVPQITAFGSAFLARRALSHFIAPERAARMEQRVSELLMKLKGTGEATHIYTMFGEGGSFVELAKRQGLGVIGDVYIALSANQIIAEEAQRFPDWADEIPAPTSREERIAINRVLLTQSDLFVCPSRFVQDDLVAHGIDPARTIIAPYAVSPKWTELQAQPEPGRVLFAGSAILRKGIHTLAAAAQILKGRCRIRVAGNVSDKVRMHPEASALEFLGHLGPQQMADEFASADVFAFPSLAEGSAGVTAEALGAGLPVVTTPEAGSIVREGIDGHIIASRDPERLASAIASIVDDREKRQEMSAAARLRAQEFTWDGFAQTVLEAI